jgi:energy-converting hydrogenase A subunit Q
MIDSYTKTPRPLRHVDVDYLVDQTKCAKCSDKPCLNSCPIDAIYFDDEGQALRHNTQPKQVFLIFTRSSSSSK